MNRGRSLNDPEKVTYFAEADARNKRTKFGIKSKDRSRHMYVIGKTGMGKSTLLENLAIQDIQSGEGLAFIDPHGKTADLLLEYIPPHRVKDVLYFAPFDMQYPVAFNIMEDVGYDKRHLVVSGLMSTFKKIWEDAWSARMEYILSNTLLALLEYPGSTLLGVNRMLADKDFRKKVVDNITDPSVKSFWVDEFAKYTERFAAEATPAIQNKIGQFTANPLIRNIIGQPKSSFDVRKMMDEKKILIINLSKGRVGESNANLLGSMLITRIYLSAMSRADSNEATLNKLPQFYLYVDEFQNFANESFADILSEARKYKLNLTVAHQYIEQMTEEVRAAVFGNVGTMVSFRVGAFDAEVLEKEFAPQFTIEDIVNLGQYQMYLKLMIDGVSSQPFSAVGMAPIPRPDQNLTETIIGESRKNFAKPRETVEGDVREWHLPIGAAAKAPLGGASPLPGAVTRPPAAATSPLAPKTFSAPGSSPISPAPAARIEIMKPPQAQVPQAYQAGGTSAPQRVVQATLQPKITPQPLQTVSAQKPLASPAKISTAPAAVSPVISQPQQPPARPISLEQLKPSYPQKKNDKKPSEQNLSSLREALAMIKKNHDNAQTAEVKTVPEKTSVVQSETKKPEAEVVVPLKDLKTAVEAIVSTKATEETVLPMPKKPEPVAAPRAPEKIIPEAVQEVPEHVLKKILAVEPPLQKT